MSLLIKAVSGITRLSELTIDADKDWQGKEIQNLKAIVAGMVRGDTVYRGADILERLLGDWGTGYNFLHVTNTGQLGVDWQDVQAMIIYLSGAVNRMITFPTMNIPTPEISLAVAEDHSGGGHTATPSLLTIPAPPSISATAEESWLLIEDCEDAWDEYVGANVTSTADTTDKKVGTYSAKMDVGVDAAVGRLATEVISKDLSTYRYLKAWVKSSVALASDDMRIMLDDSPSCETPLKDLTIPEILADTWTQITLDMGDTSGLTAIISIGIHMVVDKGAFIFRIDQVRATQGGV